MPIGDHPRSRGVYDFVFTLPGCVYGSSPLARGLHCESSKRGAGDWIIPARAGFTLDDMQLRTEAADHPRSRGVYTGAKILGGIIAGSSPLARGLLTRPPSTASVPRIIPARAGFTNAAAEHGISAEDHPRSRGVYARSTPLKTRRLGSSPLARGLRTIYELDDIQSRIIPARAGFTGRGFHGVDMILGSSPLARGLPPMSAITRLGVRIIPARAGFTYSDEIGGYVLTDHPRSRGVYLAFPTTPELLPGSSPLARGLLFSRRRKRSERRIIPARAGFTQTSSSNFTRT